MAARYDHYAVVIARCNYKLLIFSPILPTCRSIFYLFSAFFFYFPVNSQLQKLKGNVSDHFLSPRKVLFYYHRSSINLSRFFSLSVTPRVLAALSPCLAKMIKIMMPSVRKRDMGNKNRWGIFLGMKVLLKIKRTLDFKTTEKVEEKE